MKKMLCVLLTLLLTISFTGCGKSSPESVTEDFFKGLKKADQKLLDKLYLGDAGKGSIVEDLIRIIDESESLGNIGGLLSKSILDFDFEVESVEKRGDTATSHVIIKTEDWETVVSNCTILIAAKALSMALDGKSEKQMQKAFKEIIEEQRDKTEDVTFYLDLNLVNIDGDWKIDISDETSAILNAISGGLAR